jgi:hypothetical protein
MYLPSVTTGPWAPTWSPDGRELAFAMHGSIWKIPVAGGEAIQITSSSQYDSQPQWSPDGKHIAFVRDSGHAIELWVVGDDGNSPHALTHNTGINVEPEWHSASRIYYASSAGAKTLGLWQVNADSGEAEPLFADGKQSIEPTSSPDGKYVAFISSREISPGMPASYGSGDLWKLNLSDLSLHLLLRQETLWHARPRWSPDGHKIVYVSLQTGRNQLFVMDAETGLPIQLSYLHDEPFTPAWSPDSKTIAFVRNGNHEFSLWTMPAVGGVAKRIVIQRFRHLPPTGKIRVVVRDEKGKKTAARVYLQGSDGKSWAPAGAFQRVSVITGENYFQTGGGFTVELPEGTTSIEVMKGFQYEPAKKQVQIVAQQTSEVVFLLKRISDLEKTGWYSGDNHMHMNYGGVFGEKPEYLLQEAEAEDLNVINDFPTNHNTHLIDMEYFSGKLDPHSTPNRLLYFNEEYRPNFGGHMGLLNVKNFFFPVYNGYISTPYAADYPANAQVLDAMHAQGALGGYVHPFLLSRGEDPIQKDFLGAREFPADVALGRVDYYDLMCIWTDKYVAAEVLYRLWNLNFRVPVSAGTDVMPDYWRAASVGAEKVFVHTSSPLSYDNWLRDFKQGRSFVTNGPLVRMTVAGKEPGEEFQSAGGGELDVPISVEVSSVVPIEQLAILENGKVVRSVNTTDPHHIKFVETLKVSRSGWIAARVSGPEKVHMLTDYYVYAHTNPVWVTMGKQPANSPEDAAYFVKWMDVCLQELSSRAFDSPAQREEVTRTYVEAREIFHRLAGSAEAGKTAAK